MKATITPGKNSEGLVIIPPSKSLAHRYIMCASFASGKSVISNIDYSKDILATIDCVSKLGAKVTKEDNQVIIEGVSSLEGYNGEIVDCNESGSTLRFMIPLFSLTGKEVKFVGRGRLMQRPQDVYQKMFKQNNLKFIQNDDSIIIDGALKSGTYEIDGSISSQFITGMLFTLSLLADDSYIKILPPYESKDYVSLTIDTMHKFGVEIKYLDEYTLFIKGNQKYQSNDNAYVEADYSQAGFFAMLGCINQPVKMIGLNSQSLQGDKAGLDFMEKMGALITSNDKYTSVEGNDLKPIEMDLNNCPDLGPLLFALATQIEGTTKFTHCHRLRIKESDRIQTMQSELTKLGCDMQSDEDSVVIVGKTNITGGIELDGHNDHRIVMALSILATIAAKPIVINDAQAINKSYPKFFDDLRKCNIEVETND